MNYVLTCEIETNAVAKQNQYSVNNDVLVSVASAIFLLRLTDSVSLIVSF